ncbi:MAG: HAD family phosphatase [Henriciella sp.]|nr:HAD family phosphatase [Henriciella sp.]
MSAHIVLFDLGNVVVDWQPIRLYREYFDTEAAAAAFVRDVCNMDWHVNHDRGVSMAENAKPLIAKFPQYETEILAWRSRWLDMFEGYVPGTPQLMARLEEAGVPLYGLSNIPDEVADETFDAFPMIHVLRDVIVSGAEEVVKPSPEIYQIALARMGNPDPSEVLFIDDSLKNIEAANALGFRTHHFQDAAGLETALLAEGLLVAEW